MEFLTALAHNLLKIDPDAKPPVLLSVPMAEIDDAHAGHPAFDAAMAKAVEQGRPGVLVIPAELELPS